MADEAYGDLVSPDCGKSCALAHLSHTAAIPILGRLRGGLVVCLRQVRLLFKKPNSGEL